MVKWDSMKLMVKVRLNKANGLSETGSMKPMVKVRLEEWSQW